jgi:hypothetical protein
VRDTMPCGIRAAEDATDGHGWVVVDTRSRTRVRNDKHGVYTDEFVAMTNDSFVLGIDGVVFNSEIIAGIPPGLVSLGMVSRTSCYRRAVHVCNVCNVCNVCATLAATPRSRRRCTLHAIIFHAAQYTVGRAAEQTAVCATD